MAAKDFITKGIGAAPSSLLYWLNGGLGSAAAVVIPPLHVITVPYESRVVAVRADSRVVTVPSEGA